MSKKSSLQRIDQMEELKELKNSSRPLSRQHISGEIQNTLNQSQNNNINDINTNKLEQKSKSEQLKPLLLQNQYSSIKMDQFQNQHYSQNFIQNTTLLTQQIQEPDDQPKQSFAQILRTQFLILKEAIPALCCFEMQLITLTLINSYNIGHNNEPQLLVAFGMGDVLTKIIGYSIIKYLHMGLLSQCAQAYGYNKSQQKPLIGVYYQRGLLISGFCCIILSPLFYLSDQILILMGIDAEIAKLAGEYVWVALPSFYAFTYYDATKSFLQSQDLFAAPMYMQICQVIFQFFLSDYLINDRQLKLHGAAWAKNISDAFACILIYFYCDRKNKIKDSWIEWNQSAFNRISSYLKYAVTMGLAGYIQEFSFYILTIISGHFTSQVDTATNIALSNSQQWHYNFFLGFHIVMINYLGKQIMSGKMIRARNIVFQGVFLTFFFSIITIGLILLNENIWVNLFTTIQQVSENLEQAIYIYCLVLLFDSIQLTYCGILKGTDQQKHIIKVYIVAYLVIALPTSYTLGFGYEMGVRGLYIGWLCGGIVSTICFIFIFIFKTNWYIQFKNIQKRMLKEKYAVKKENELLETKFTPNY